MFCVRDNIRRSSSISIDRSKKLEDDRRSSSLFGRLVRYVNKERARVSHLLAHCVNVKLEKIYGVSITSLRTNALLTPDGRQSRSRQKKRTPNPSLRREIIHSLDQTAEISRRLSMRDNVIIFLCYLSISSCREPACLQQAQRCHSALHFTTNFQCL